MSTHDAATRNGRGRSSGPTTLSEVDVLRATCTRQSLVIDKLSEAVSILRRGAAALKAENSALRAENASAHNELASHPRVAVDFEEHQLIELRLPLDRRACSVARSAVTEFICGRISSDCVANTQLLITELISNSVRHSNASPCEPIVIRVQFSAGTLRLSVEDSGASREFGVRPANLQTGTGFGLNLLEALSDQWAVEPVPEGGTRVWADVSAKDTPRGARTPSLNGRPVGSSRRPPLPKLNGTAMA
jgi:anti-sigma regulatory factor (Ser/Thr protein kinase)